MEQGSAGSGHPRAWTNQSTATRTLNVVVLPLALGVVAGAFLHVPVGYWIVSLLAAVGAFVAGSEHPTAGPAAVRGLVAGVVYGLGILIVFYSIRHGVEVKVDPSPSIGTPLVTGIAGAVLTALGALALGRRAAH